MEMLANGDAQRSGAHEDCIVVLSFSSALPWGGTMQCQGMNLKGAGICSEIVLIRT